MAKLKKATLSMNNKEKSFAYEIIGIVSLLISLISIAKFGVIGKYLVLTFSLLFGDWYFIFIALVGVFGVYCLIFHKKVELKSIRYYGIMLILLSLLIVSHFSMHDYVRQFEGNSLKTTMNLYFDYFKSNSTSMIKGGGIVGCLCFYLSYYLLGKMGTILISLILLFIGIVFLSKKTIREFIEMIIKIFKKIVKFIKRRFDNVIDSMIEISKDYNDKHSNSIKKNKKRVKKEEKDILEIENCENNMLILHNVFKHLNVVTNSITYLICEHIVVYFIKTELEVNYKVLEFSLKDKLDENYLIKYDKYNDQLILELNKKTGATLSFKKALKEVNKEESALTLGIDDRNLIVELVDNLIIFCNDKEFLLDYLISMISFYVYPKKQGINSMTIIDCDNLFKDDSYSKVEIIKDLDFLSKIVDEIDENLELLNLHHKKDVDEYNMFYQKKIIKQKYIIVGIEHIVYKQGYFNKLLYIVQTCKMAGITVILTLSENVSLSSILFSSFDKKLILKNNFDFVNSLIDNTFFEVINSNIEGFYIDKELVIRMCLLMMTEPEKEKYSIKKTS